jgi:multicomponent K+:H+ antiporter subunit A
MRRMKGPSDAPRRRPVAAVAAGAIALAACAFLLWLAPAVFDDRTLLWHASWVPEIGLALSFRLDGLALMFGLLVTGIGALVVLYAAYYLGPNDPPGKFYAYLVLFMAAMLGVVLADNLLLLVVFWELTSITSFLLIGYWGHRADARAGARMAVAVTGGGGLALLAGVLVLGHVGGSFELTVLMERGDVIRAHPLYPVAMGLVLVGAFTKSAQFPFHFWLPEAMAAPTPVSAYLHSATMVKAGVFLLARMYPVIGGTDLFELVVCSTGLLTLVFGAYVAVFKHDLKGLLAYSTISHLGLITFLIGLNSPLSAVAAVFHILNHATFKASLFMTAGIVDHETGTRDMRQLGGLVRFMPFTTTLAMVAAAAMAGVPLANGFLSKEMFFDEALHAGGAVWSWLVPAMAVAGGVCSVAYSLRFIHDVFFNGDPKDMPNPHPHEAPLLMKVPVIALVAVCIAVGVMPGLIVGPMVQVGAGALLGTAPPRYELALWHGFNLPLLMSGISLAGGVAMYFALLRKFDLHLDHPKGWTARIVFTHAHDALFTFARRVTAAMETGSLQRYAALLVGFAVAVAAAPFLAAEAAPGTGARALLPATPLALALWAVLLAAGAALIAAHRHRFVAVVLAGIVGLVTALSFEALSAPDLALTQLSVEVVSTVLLLLGLALLPAAARAESSLARRLRDGVLALGGGAGVAWLAWLAMTRDHESIAWYFQEQSAPAGGGTNVVNVILVDFRGFDTFGEITVLAIAAVGVLALLGGWRARRSDRDPEGRPWSFARPPLMLRVAAQVILPLALAVGVYLFWRGHNLPGGGFIAGLVTAAALVLQYMALGQRPTDLLMGGADPAGRLARGLAAGLGIAALTGAGAFAVQRPFLSSAYGHPHVPVLGELSLASAALFDLGVYVTVVAATLLMMSMLAAAGSRGGPAGARDDAAERRP